MMQEENNQSIKTIITGYVNLVKDNWYWFLISIVVCCFVAVSYISVTPKMYERKAKIIFREDIPKIEPKEVLALSEIDFFSNTNANNEIEVLRSHKIMQDVVQQLNLETNYELHSGLKHTNLYLESPITATFLDAKEDDVFSVRIKFLSDKKIKLSDFKTKSRLFKSESLKANLYDTIQTPLGRICVSPTIFYSDEFIKKSVYVTKSNSRETAENFKSALNVVMEKNKVIILSITDNSIQRAEDILNTILAVYDQDRIANKSLVVTNTSNFINERLEIIKGELETVDRNRSNYKKSNVIADIKKSTDIFLTESSNFDKQVLDLQNKLSVAEFIKEYITNPVNSNNLIPSNSGTENVPLEKQISEYNLLMLKRARLMENSSEKSPIVTEQTNTLLAMKQTIVRSVDNLISALNLQISAISNKASKTNQKIADVPEKEMDLTSIERRLKIHEDLYLYLLKKREENELSGAINKTNYKIIDEAEGSTSPISPKKHLILLIAIVAGAFIPFVILYVKELLNTTVKYVDDITNNLTIPFLGTIPQKNKNINILKNKNNKHHQQNKDDVIVIKNGNQDTINEAFRILRTNINLLNSKQDDNAKVIMLTSFNESAGKSFVALNLAISFAIAKKKTLLVDLDLRKARLSSWLNLSNTGISDYLNDTTSLEKLIIHEPFQEHLDIISAGILPSNPVELLLNDDKLHELIHNLRKTYQYIILDTTACDTVADAAIIEKVSDMMTLFVLRKGMSDSCKFPELEAMYKNTKFANMTVLLNGI